MPEEDDELLDQIFTERQLAINNEIQKAVGNTAIPHLYFNGFSTTLSTGDILIVLKQNDVPVAVLNASYTVAKTLVQKVGGVIDKLEKITGNTVMTTDNVGDALTEAARKEMEEHE